MYGRKRLARERMEIYLVHLLLRSRRLFWAGGVLLLIYAGVLLLTSPLSGCFVAVLALFPLQLSSSERAVLLAARIGAWLGRRGTLD